MQPGDSDTGEIFKRRTVIALAVVAALSLALALVIGARSGAIEDRPVSAGPNAFSSSAIGHRALVLLLERAGANVLISRHTAAGMVGPTAPLLIAEPPAEDDEAAQTEESGRLADLVGAATNAGAPVVLVLPKWSGRPMQLKPSWVEHVELRPPAYVVAVLYRALGGELSAPLSEIVRVGPLPPDAFQSALGGDERPRLPLPQLIRANATALEPLVWSDDGVLIGRVHGTSLYVVSDPDLFNTAGLARGDNAALARKLFIDHIRAKSLIVDETLHGFRKTPSLWAELLELPLLLVTLHVVALLALAAWAAAGRFGAPEPVPPRVPAGKRTLIDNTAELLTLGGHTQHSLREYFQATVRKVAAACGLPQGLSEPETVARLSSLARARGVNIDLATIQQAIASYAARDAGRQALAAARALHRFRKEMIGEYG